MLLVEQVSEQVELIKWRMENLQLDCVTKRMVQPPEIGYTAVTGLNQIYKLKTVDVSYL